MSVPRFRVLQRDGFRCVYCGATPDVSELHVDHYQPISRGGTNDMLNLRTACARCNLSKGAHEPQWRHCSAGERNMDPWDRTGWRGWSECA